MQRPKVLWADYIKRPVDALLALLALIVMSPILLAIGAGVKLDDGGSVFYRGTRTGLYGKPFQIFKFRTMVVAAERMGGPSTAANDPRLTRIGPSLRRYKLDEFPQLINILFGEMSFVGPRPQVQAYTDLYTEKQQIMLDVRPGLTDYASNHFFDLDRILGDTDVDEKYLNEIEPEKNRLRTRYVEEVSFLSDMKILLATAVLLLRRCSTWNTDN
jgi:lipopolysaccharide/colanic/teichoic acid biosynthesis glycosyltransferase